MRQPSVVLVIAVALLAAGLTHAQTQQPGRRGGASLQDRFKQFDRNGDGKVGADEFPGLLFKQIDKDGDGFVTMDEAREYYRSRPSRQPAPVAPPASVVSTEQVNAPPGPAPATPPVSASRAFTDLRFARDCQPGARDDRGRPSNLRAAPPWSPGLCPFHWEPRTGPTTLKQRRIRTAP